ncbi:voltage-gated chloride channel family protein [Aquibacillus kalidii]|uniref:voltage-gated chloride channel family protein n=1 Tax=Aquibacillus kalidii TaxID=2762597 RepID=UPI001646D1ED|nr:voltage-gated chloride channel family protein [Aquibacillus kalidii]
MSKKQKSNQFIFTLMQWIILGTIIGIVVGSATAFLLEINDYLGAVREKKDWLIYLLPISGIVIGYIYMNYGKVYVADNLHDAAKLNNLVIEAVHGKKKILKRMGPIAYISTFLTVFFGGSTGREGAAVQMGTSIAESVNKLLKVNLFDKRLYIMSGISAGFGAAFGTPLAGTFFGMEMAILGMLKFEAIIPCLVASYVAHFITTGAWGVHHEELLIQAVPDLSVLTFIKVIGLSIIFGLLSVGYSQLRHGIQHYSEKLFKKNHMKRAFTGGLIIVLLTVIVGSQDYNGRGLNMLQQSFSGDVTPFAFLAKLIFTAITLGFGFVGGEAIPLFFMGATLGNTLHNFIDMPLTFLAALGLIATFSGGTNTPITSFFLALEMFKGEGIEYFFVACIVSYIVSGNHGLWPSQQIYEPKSKLFSIANGETIEKVKKKRE